MADIEEIVRLGLRLIKIHPPHQLFYPNDYLKGMKELELLYRAAESNDIPVMFHTGTSIFPGARNKYGDPIHIDDVAVDFPQLKIVLAHGGRPLWMDTAFFLVRRHPSVYLDISSIPPGSCSNTFLACRRSRTRPCSAATGRVRVCATSRNYWMLSGHCRCGRRASARFLSRLRWPSGR
jgi:predicted TIM-barrel fold metal-dependent hydrolase